MTFEYADVVVEDGEIVPRVAEECGREAGVVDVVCGRRNQRARRLHRLQQWFQSIFLHEVCHGLINKKTLVIPN